MKRGIDPGRAAELREHLEDLRFASGCVYRLRMGVNYYELPSPSRTAIHISNLEREIERLHAELKKAWT